MSDENPSVILYDQNSNRMYVHNGVIIPANTPAMLVSGRDDSGYARDLRLDQYGNMYTQSPTYNLTAFGETRSAEPHILGNNVNKYDIDGIKYDIDTNGGSSVITHVADESAIRLAIGATSGDYAKLRTNQYYRYQAGRSFLIRQTGYHPDTGQTNQVRRWGLFDDNDGIFWELDGTTLYIVRRTSTSGSPVDNRIAQTSWNEDTCDGNGPSGFDLDITKGNIFEFSLQWLGVGIVSISINGIVCHTMHNPNQYSAPYMKTATLPLAWEIINTGASVASNFTYICSSVTVEGGQDFPEFSFAAYNSSDVAVSPTERPLLSIRPSLAFNSIENRMSLIPCRINVSTEGSRASYRVIVNAGLTGASWSSVDSQSGAEYDVAATAFTGGFTLEQGLLPNSIDSKTVDLTRIFSNTGRALRRDAFGTDRSSITITGKKEQAAGTTNMRASISWLESR